MGLRRLRRAWGLSGGALAATALVLGLTANSTQPDAAPGEPPRLADLRTAPGTVSSFPPPGSSTASPETQISLRGAPAAQIGDVTVVGEVSGEHPGTLREHTDGQGASFVPDEAVTPGERVTVTTDAQVRGADGPSYSFVIAVPGERIPLEVPPVERQGPDVPVRRFLSEPQLQPPVVETRIAGTTGPGYTVVGVKNGYAQKGPMLVDDAGEPVWFLPLEGKDARDVNVQTYRGEPVLTWWEGRQPAGYGYGEVVVLDRRYREVARFDMGNGYGADSHEVLLTDQGTALLLAYEAIATDLSPLGGPVDGEVVDNVVQEVDVETGAVLFEWHTLGTIGLAESYLPATDQPFDYAHLNSIDVDDDGDLLVSARHTCAVYKIDRETGDVLWRLGGRMSDFRLGEGARFLKQHDVRRSADGTVTVFDNGGECGEHVRESSRGIALALDEEAGTAELVREHVHPDQLFAESQGSYQELGAGQVLLGWGSLPRWTQLAADGTVVLDATIPDELVITSYRARRAPWTGLPPTDPVAVVTGTSATDAVVHASWNGATEVATWRVLAGGAEVGRAPRTGFESAVPVETAVPVEAAGVEAAGAETTPGALVVQALGTDGAVLGQTVAVAVVPGTAGELYARLSR